MDITALQAQILRLLGEVPLDLVDVKNDIRQSVAAGEVALAYDTLCSWIYEESLPISHTVFASLAVLAAHLEQDKWVERLRPLVRDDLDGMPPSA